MQVQVFGVRIPALSTIGYGYGINVETGAEIVFAATIVRFAILVKPFEVRVSHLR